MPKFEKGAIRISDLNISDLDKVILLDKQAPSGITGEVADLDIKKEFVFDSLHENRGKGIYDADSKTVTFYLADEQKVNDVKDDILFEYIRCDIKIFNASEVLDLEADPDMQRTCQYFTADKKTVTDRELVISPDYRFHNVGLNCSCSHPNVVEADRDVLTPCNYADTQATCPIYEAQDWTPVRIVEGVTKEGNKNKVQLQLETSRRGLGRNLYRFSQDERHSEPSENLDEFNEAVAKLVETKDVPTAETAEKVSFLEFVTKE